MPRASTKNTTRRLARCVSGALLRSDDLRRPPYRGHPDPIRGHCYIASEALFHLLGGRRAGWQAQHIRHEGAPHWYLRNAATGEVLDPTADQFRSPVAYQRGRGIGFLTRAPSRRTRALLSRLRRWRMLPAVRAGA